MSIAPQSSVIPRRIDALKACTQGAVYEGVIMPRDLPRLSSAVVSMERDVVVKVRFFRDEGRFRVVAGEFDALVEVECQRCLQACTYILQTELNLAIVVSEDQLQQLPENYEAWLVEEAESDLYEVIEDELLLALPIVAYHDEEDCGAESRYSTGEFDEGELRSKKANPFDVLGSLKPGFKPESDE